MNLDLEMIAWVAGLTLAVIQVLKAFKGFAAASQWHAPVAVGAALALAWPVMVLNGKFPETTAMAAAVWFLNGLAGGLSACGLYSAGGKQAMGVVANLLPGGKPKVLLPFGIALALTASSGCQLSDGQRYKLASDSYQGAVRSIVTASKAGVLGTADMEAISPYEEEAFLTLAKMRDALMNGRNLDFEFLYLRSRGIIDKLIVLAAKGTPPTKRSTP